MNQRGRQQENLESSIRNSEIEKDDGVDCKTILDPKGVFMFKWHTMFLLSCVIAVLCVDPLFFYLPVINENYKCLMLDRRLLITTISLRSVFDMIYLANIIFGYFSRRSRGTGFFKEARQITKKYLRSNFLIDILAILPIPQVLVPIIFSRIKRSNFLHLRKLLNFFVLFQYVPRVLRIYLSWTKHIESSRKLAGRVWIKAAFNIFLYILASHVLGGIWYFFSIQQEMACWHIACENHFGCTPSSFSCARNSGNYTFLDDTCPIRPPNTTIIDFGIFEEALQSGTVSSTNIPQKIMHCFWWGLRNLSSLGQNLQTSTNFWENFFAVFISIFGLLLFLYFIGNAQTYLQMATTKATEKADKMEKIRNILESVKPKLDPWMDRNQLPSNMKEPIINCIQRRLEENKDFDMEKPFSHLSKDLLTEIKHRLCLPLLEKVESLKNEKEYLQQICESIKPLYYEENSCILEEGKPVTRMCFITQDSVYCNTTSNGENGQNGERIDSHADQCIEKVGLYGEELLEWGFKCSPSSDLSKLPLSNKTVRIIPKVEAFTLMANDAKNLALMHAKNHVPRHTQAATAVKNFALAAAKGFAKGACVSNIVVEKQNSTSNHLENSGPAAPQDVEKQ